MSGVGRTRGLRVVVTDGRGRALSAAGLASWLTQVAPRAARGVVGVALVSDRRVRELNRQFLGKDYATDVLSFPAAGPKDPPSFAPSSHQPPATSDRSQPPASRLLLGDIVIARGVARRQAREAHHSEATELKLLALHGLLHLLGYDHEQEDDGRMLRLERRLRRKAGLREGLIERGHRARPGRR